MTGEPLFTTIVLTTTCRVEDARELLDGLIEFTTNDPWSMGSRFQMREHPNSDDWETFGDLWEEAAAV